MKKIICLLATASLSFLCLPSATSQQFSHDVVSAGGDFHRNNNFGSLHWTIGEPVTETLSNSGFRLTQGFHQVYYYILTHVANASVAPINVKVYPNPTAEHAILEAPDAVGSLLEIRHISGQFLHQARIQSDKTDLDLSPYPAGMYLLTIVRKDGLSYSFKLQKVQY